MNNGLIAWCLRIRYSGFADPIQKVENVMSKLLPILDDKGLDAAIREIDRLLDSNVPDDDTTLDALSDAVESYEQKHFPMPPSIQAEMLTSLMEAMDIDFSEFAKATKIPLVRIEEVVSGVAQLSAIEVRKLDDFFGQRLDRLEEGQ